MACSAVDCHGELAFDDTAPVPVDSPHNAPETCERPPQFENILTPPPEGVPLLGERPRRLDSGMDEEKTAILCESGVPERREQRSMTRRRIHGAAQSARPPGDCAGAVTARSEPLPQVAAIGPNCRLHARVERPMQELAWIG